MSKTQWWEYLESLLNGQTAKEAAAQTGISASNFTRWKQGARADPDFVVKIARAYKANVLDALVEADFITEDEAKLTEVAPTLDLAKVSGPDLIEELERRVDMLRYLESLSPSGDATIRHIADRRRNSNNASHRVPPISDDELADAIREANEQPQAAHPATEELTEPESP